MYCIVHICDFVFVMIFTFLLSFAFFSDEGWTTLVSKRDRKQQKTPKTPPQEDDPKESSPAATGGKKGAPAKAAKKSESTSSVAKDESGGKGQGKMDPANPVTSDASAVSPGDASKKEKKTKAKEETKQEQQSRESSPQKNKAPGKKKESPKVTASGDSEEKQSGSATKDGNKPVPGGKDDNDGWIEVKGSSSPASSKKKQNKASSAKKDDGDVSSKARESPVPSQEPQLSAVKETPLESLPSPVQGEESQGSAKSKSKKKKQKVSLEPIVLYETWQQVPFVIYTALQEQLLGIHDHKHAKILDLSVGHDWV